MALSYDITGDYFTAMGISLVQGRAFTDGDTESASKVVVINETLARRLWSGRTPLGERLRVGEETAPREIVGTVGDTKQTGLAKDTDPQFYLPAGGRQPRLDMTLVVRTTSDARMIAGLLRSQVALLDKDLPTFRINTMEEVLSESTSAYRFRGILLATFAALALIVAAVGVYGVVAYSVSSRTHEIGVRMSLGARPQDILLMILREGAVLALVGVGIGSAAAFGLNRFISNLLYGITPNDPTTFIVSAIVLVTGAFVACVLPAFAASKVDPAIALRHE